MVCPFLARHGWCEAFAFAVLNSNKDARFLLLVLLLN